MLHRASIVVAVALGACVSTGFSDDLDAWIDGDRLVSRYESAVLVIARDDPDDGPYDFEIRSFRFEEPGCVGRIRTGYPLALLVTRDDPGTCTTTLDVRRGQRFGRLTTTSEFVDAGRFEVVERLPMPCPRPMLSTALTVLEDGVVACAEWVEGTDRTWIGRPGTFGTVVPLELTARFDDRHVLVCPPRGRCSIVDADGVVVTSLTEDSSPSSVWMRAGPRDVYEILPSLGNVVRRRWRFVDGEVALVELVAVRLALEGEVGRPFGPDRVVINDLTGTGGWRLVDWSGNELARGAEKIAQLGSVEQFISVEGRIVRTLDEMFTPEIPGTVNAQPGVSLDRHGIALYDFDRYRDVALLPDATGTLRPVVGSLPGRIFATRPDGLLLQLSGETELMLVRARFSRD